MRIVSNFPCVGYVATNFMLSAEAGGGGAGEAAGGGGGASGGSFAEWREANAILKMEEKGIDGRRFGRRRFPCFRVFRA